MSVLVLLLTGMMSSGDYFLQSLSLHVGSLSMPPDNRFIFAQADLSKPETIPATLVGIHTVIDCATGRPEEPIKTVSISVDL